LPAVHEVRPRVDGGVAADDARVAVAVALDLDRGLDRGRDLNLGLPRTRDLLEGEHPEARDLVRDLELLELALGLDRLRRLEQLGHVGQPGASESLLDQPPRRQRDGARLAALPPRRNPLPPPPPPPPAPP